MAPTRLAAIGLATALLTAALAVGNQSTPGDQAAAVEQIVIRITGLRNDDGRLGCGLFGEDNWLGAGAIDGEGGEIENGIAVCTFSGVESGVYAISTYHDENGNDQLDTGFLRIPKEGVAASNNAYRKFGPPRYRDAKFDYAGGTLELTAEMRYIRGD